MRPHHRWPSTEGTSEQQCHILRLPHEILDQIFMIFVGTVSPLEPISPFQKMITLRSVCRQFRFIANESRAWLDMIVFDRIQKQISMLAFGQSESQMLDSYVSTVLSDAHLAATLARKPHWALFSVELLQSMCGHSCFQEGAVDIFVMEGGGPYYGQKVKHYTEDELSELFHRLSQCSKLASFGLDSITVGTYFPLTALSESIPQLQRLDLRFDELFVPLSGSLAKCGNLVKLEFSQIAEVRGDGNLDCVLLPVLPISSATSLTSLQLHLEVKGANKVEADKLSHPLFTKALATFSNLKHFSFNPLTSGICGFLDAAKIKLVSLGVTIGNTRRPVNGNRLVSIFSAPCVRELEALSFEDLCDRLEPHFRDDMVDAITSNIHSLKTIHLDCTVNLEWSEKFVHLASLERIDYGYWTCEPSLSIDDETDSDIDDPDLKESIENSFKRAYKGQPRIPTLLIDNEIIY